MFARVVSSGSLEKFIDADYRYAKALPYVISSGSLEKYIDADYRYPKASLPHVISSGSIERYVEIDDHPVPCAPSAEISRQQSYCSLADLQCNFSVSASELERMLDAQLVPARHIPTLPTTWEYVRSPRRPDSATSNSLLSSERDSDVGDTMSNDGFEAAAPPEVVPLVTSVSQLMDEPFVVMDEGGEFDVALEVRSPQSVFESGRWY